MKAKMIGVKFFALLILLNFALNLPAQTSPGSFPVKRQETPETWRRGGLEAIQRTKNLDFKRRKAKNVILFVGDGMGISTLTAARILRRSDARRKRRGKSSQL